MRSDRWRPLERGEQRCWAVPSSPPPDRDPWSEAAPTLATPTYTRTAPILRRLLHLGLRGPAAAAGCRPSSASSPKRCPPSPAQRWRATATSISTGPSLPSSPATRSPASASTAATATATGGAPRSALVPLELPPSSYAEFLHHGLGHLSLSARICPTAECRARVAALPQAAGNEQPTLVDRHWVWGPSDVWVEGDLVPDTGPVHLQPPFLLLFYRPSVLRHTGHSYVHFHPSLSSLRVELLAQEIDPYHDSLPCIEAKQRDQAEDAGWEATWSDDGDEGRLVGGAQRGHPPPAAREDAREARLPRIPLRAAPVTAIDALPTPPLTYGVCHRWLGFVAVWSRASRKALGTSRHCPPHRAPSG